MIAGTCIIVNDAPENHGMKPKRVQPNSAEIAPRTPAITTLRVRSLDITTPFSDVGPGCRKDAQPQPSAPIDDGCGDGLRHPSVIPPLRCTRWSVRLYYTAVHVDRSVRSPILMRVKPLVTIDHVAYQYKLPEGSWAAPKSPRPALREISLEIQEGEYVAVLGANGSGKSTLARHLNALLLPDRGRVIIAGLDTRDNRSLPEIRRTVGMVFQRPEDQIVATLVSHDVAFGPENLGLPQGEIHTRVEAALRAVDLWDDRDRPPHMLSAGQMQRLALAGVLAMRPRCIVFDEATAMLDPAGRRAARALMTHLHHEGYTIITITHLMEEALDADRVVVLHEGTLAIAGTPEEVFGAAALLHELGLDLPPALRLGETLRRQVPELPGGRLSLAALVEALDALPHGKARSAKSISPERWSNARGAAAIIEASELGHTYMQDTPFARRALEDVRLTVSEGEAHGLIGATGSGKSTLLQHLNGLLRPQEGAVRIGPYNLADPNVDIAAVRRMAGLVFQMPEVQIFEQYVGDEVAYGPKLAGLQGEGLRERVCWAMGLVGLDFESFKDRFTFAISGGEKRKVALASTLALRPELLLLDEPTAGLDPASRYDLLDRLKQLQGEGMTLVLSSHQMEDIAKLTRRVTVMSEGTTTLDGTTVEVFSQRDVLRSWDLEPPVATRLADALIEKGWELPPGIVDEGQLVDALEGCLRLTP